MQESSKKLSIIGAGRVGKSIARLVSEKTALSIGVVINRTMAKAEESVGFIGAGTPASYGKNLQDACTRTKMPNESIIPSLINGESSSKLTSLLSVMNSFLINSFKVCFRLSNVVLPDLKVFKSLMIYMGRVI